MRFKGDCQMANDVYPSRTIRREWVSQRAPALRAHIAWSGDELVQASRAARFALLKAGWVAELLEPERPGIFSAEPPVEFGASGGRD